MLFRAFYALPDSIKGEGGRPVNALLELEVLDGVREVDGAAVDARLLEPSVELPPGRPDERPSLEVLLVAGLLADEDDARPLAALAEDRLRRGRVQVAAATPLHGVAQVGQREPLGEERLGRGRGGHAKAVPAHGYDVSAEAPWPSG